MSGGWGLITVRIKKAPPKQGFFPFTRADVRSRGPFNMLLDDYSALVIASPV